MGRWWWGKAGKRSIDLSQNGCRWPRSMRMRMLSIVPAPLPVALVRVRRSVVGQRGRNKFLRDWLEKDFKLELAARCSSAVGCSPEGSGGLPRWSQEDSAESAAGRGSSGAGFGRRESVGIGEPWPPRGSGRRQHLLSLHWSSLRAGSWSGLPGGGWEGWGTSFLAPCFLQSRGVFLR